MKKHYDLFDIEVSKEGTLLGIVVNPKASEIKDAADCIRAAHALAHVEYKPWDVMQPFVLVYDAAKLLAVKEDDIGLIRAGYQGGDHMAPEVGWMRLNVLNGETYNSKILPTYKDRATGEIKKSNRNINTVERAEYIHRMLSGEGIRIDFEKLADDFVSEFLGTICVDRADTKAREIAWAEYQKRCQDSKWRRITGEQASKALKTQKQLKDTIKFNGKEVKITEVPAGKYEFLVNGESRRTDNHYATAHGRAKLAVLAEIEGAELVSC